MSDIAPIPVEYSEVRFRSTLEADWAATLDAFGIEWQYEPIGVQLPSGILYRPDFYLPQIATWLEVKGPAGERLDKTRELARAVQCEVRGCDDTDTGLLCDGSHYWNPWQLVAVGLAPVRGKVTSYLIDSGWGSWRDDYDALTQCGSCSAWWWCGSGAYGCRAHRRGGGGDDDLHNSTYIDPVFMRARGVA